MSIHTFANKENIQMLWDVISDEHQFRFLPPDIQSSVYTLFINNIPGFYENEKHKNNTLVDINKKYILLIVSHIQKTYAHQPSKIKIHSDPPIHGITAEDIQQERKSRINHDFVRRQEEFDDSMTMKAPEVPEFTDKHTDQPIKEMDKLLKEMHAQRNYEVAQINREYSPADKWLAPQETSLKPTIEKREADTSVHHRLKHLPQLDLPKKSVTFNNDDQVNTFVAEEDDEDLNVFAKLKKVNTTVLTQANKEENEHALVQLERNVASLHEKIDRLIALIGARI